MTDEAIIDMYFDRDEEAIRASDIKYGRYCIAVADNILANLEDAEECVNDTWLRAWNAIPPERPNVLKLFFARITRNLAINRYRASNAKKRGCGEITAVLEELEGCISDKSTESMFDSAELSRAVNSFLEELEARERAIFLRRYFFAEDTETIAMRYAIKNGNVRTVLSRTRKKLKAYLIKEGFTV